MNESVVNESVVNESAMNESAVNIFLDSLRPAFAAGALRDVDFHLARHLLALAALPSEPVALAIATLSRAQADGDICIDLAALAARTVLAEQAMGGRSFRGVAAPALVDWCAALHSSGLVAPAELTLSANVALQLPAINNAPHESGKSGDSFPLVLDAANRLYFRKYFHFEKRIAAGLLQRSNGVSMHSANSADNDATNFPFNKSIGVHAGIRIESALTQQFPGQPGSDHDPHQRAAARLALTQQLAVITGGPGTGKTTTVTKILAAMIALAGNETPRIRLAAPTGKAAARLGESIRGAKANLLAQGTPADQVARIPEDASTLHRLIGTRPDTRRPRHHADNPLSLDVLVIDEASMIDVPLMARVVAALPAHARLVLLGDRDQLASVEAGAVLGDICAGASASVATLVTSHRFRDDSGIGALARAINRGDAAATVAALASDAATALVSGDATTVLDTLVTNAVTAWRDYLTATDITEASRRFGNFRALCALRDGAFGVSGVNARIEHALNDAGLVDARERFYRGRPLLITANDYGIHLFNGDIGLVWPAEDGQLRACFVAADATLRSFPLNRLPAHETCYAMTVHKSQGSEFDTVALVLPEQDSSLLTRELIYTAVTRARSRVMIYGSGELLAKATDRQVSRSSGLRDALVSGTSGAI